VIGETALQGVEAAPVGQRALAELAQDVFEPRHAAAGLGQHVDRERGLAPSARVQRCASP
jgi:hypothetical protein